MTTKSALILLLRLGVSAGLLIFLFVWVDVDFGTLWPDDGTAVAWLGAALGCVVGSVVLAALRWKQVCQALNLQVSTWRLIWHNFAGQFVSSFLPTTVGGDVVRVSRLGKDTGDRPTSFTTVIFERLSGWMVLPASIFLGLALDSNLRSLGAATRGAFIAAVMTLVVLLVIIIAAGNDYSGRLLARYESSLAWVHAIHEGLDVLRNKPREVGRILASGAVYQGVLVLGFWCAAHSIGIEGFGFRVALAFVPAVLIVQVLPLGIGGLGVREGALALFLGELGVPREEAVALGLTIYALTIITSLIGLPSLVFNTASSDENPVEATAELT
ncbi:MAG: lysylphosphatidylglycerol synthase transmembrane domain-containing protein [Acidimicrobiales bacterium]|jgi:uncharacterized membrane protein YbhN (UPF0104 family)